MKLDSGSGNMPDLFFCSVTVTLSLYVLSKLVTLDLETFGVGRDIFLLSWVSREDKFCPEPKGLDGCCGLAVSHSSAYVGIENRALSINYVVCACEHAYYMNA